ncbi:MAG: glycosyltransferase [Acidimicrobiia bacterium]|nr:glycosyltransferase [Acidimicrobiia bacterium]
MKSAIQHADSLIVLTESARSMFDGLVDPDRVTVIGNCIEPWLEERACSHSPVLGSPPKILYLGNLITGKGVETLGAAARLSYAAGNDSQFLVAGLGDESLLGSPTPPNMKLLGQVLGDRKVQALASADVLVLPSELNEGEPISVLEAFHFGIPVVATGNGGLRDLVQPEAGRVFEAGDADALLRAVAEVLEPEAWLRMSNRNQKVARADHSSAAHEISMLQALGVNR